MTRVKPFSCLRDGLRIRGLQFIPEADKPLPAAIFCHEFIVNQLSVLSYAAAAAKLGYAAFCFDFCGGGIISLSGGKTTEMSVLTEVRDLMAVIEYVKGLPYTDERKLVLAGFSQGGLVSALAAAELKDRLSALILQYPALSIPDDARKGHMITADIDPENLPETFRCAGMRLGRRYAGDVLGLDPFEVIGRYTGKVLLIHGDADRLVDVSYSRKAFDLYQKAGARAELKEIEGAGHLFLNPRHKKLAKRYMREFLENNM